MTQSIQIGLIGFGNVGQGVLSIIDTNQATIVKRVGQPVQVKSICVRNVDKYAGLVDQGVLTNNVDDIILDPDIDIVVEVIGGEQPAYDFITRALEQKKYVVTANKELIAKHKQHFFELAKANGVDIFLKHRWVAESPLLNHLRLGTQPIILSLCMAF